LNVPDRSIRLQQPDRCHDRQAFSTEGFRRLIEAARSSKKIDGISGFDRKMMCILALWTGFRESALVEWNYITERADEPSEMAIQELCRRYVFL
jgi:hypothetical protein